ncbi:MAG: UDP-N-acetylglucosamine--N-acetylmuramyl-(pentapeptide) pyrophosphoryl-undecaprenol N-acetylglucosamine transferase [bacterium]
MPSTTAPPITYLFAGGGTGGHLYPALAIWEELRALVPSADAHLLCSSRPIDREVLTPHAIPFTPLPAQYPGLAPRQLWRFLSNWPPSVRATRQVIQQARKLAHPVHLITLGGFVAAPAVQAARAERIPITLINIDAVPGKANRWIAQHAQHAFTTVASPSHPHWKHIPPIVRRAARQVRDRTTTRAILGLDPALPVLLITGGSLGARTLNNLLHNLASNKAHQPVLSNWQILHQTGSTPDAERLQTTYTQAGIRAQVLPFTEQLPLWWSAADFALSRAGAGAVAEAWASGTPTLFAPYPHHKDQHQRFNAQTLVQAHAAEIADDLIDDQSNLQGPLGQALLRLLKTPATLATMRTAAENLGPADGALQIAQNLAQKVL